MIINIRGSGGSGKTVVMKGIISQFGPPKEVMLNGKVVAYDLQDGIRVAGRYNIPTGGTDALGYMKVTGIEALLRQWAHEMPHLLFEGIMISTVWEKWANFAEEFADAPYIWAFLDTPEQMCYDRILQRNGGKPVSRDNARAKWRINERHIVKARAAGFNVRILRYEHALKDALAILSNKEDKTPTKIVAARSETPQLFSLL